MKNARMLAAGAALALGFCLLSAGGTSADDKDVRDPTDKIAEAIAKGDTATAKKLAAGLAKSTELDNVMRQMALRTKKGRGVGAKANEVMPDGIEAKIIALSKKPLPQKQLDTESKAITDAAYIAAAIGEVAHSKPPEKDEGMKKKKDWMGWSEEMSKSAVQLADAAKAKKPNDVKAAATKLNNSCSNCHGVFRD
jgi:hypothetical protein